MKEFKLIETLNKLLLLCSNSDIFRFVLFSPLCVQKWHIYIYVYIVLFTPCLASIIAVFYGLITSKAHISFSPNNEALERGIVWLLIHTAPGRVCVGVCACEFNVKNSSNFLNALLSQEN